MVGWSPRENLILGQLQGMKCTQVSQIPQGCHYLMITTPSRTVSLAPLLGGRKRKGKEVYL